MEVTESNYRPGRLIHEFRLRNMLSFGADMPPLKLGNLNVLIGPNGSGKSNLIEAIGLMQALPNDVWKPVVFSGGLREWVHKGSKDFSMGLGGSICLADGRLVQYNGYMASPTEFGYTIDEWIGVATQDGQGTTTNLYSSEPHSVVIEVYGQQKEFEHGIHKRAQSALAVRRDPDATPELAELGDRLRSIRLYRRWSMGADNPLREPQHTDVHAAWLEEDFSNFGMFMNMRFARDPVANRRLIEALKDIYEGFSDIRFVADGQRLNIVVHEGDMAIPAVRLSDGTLRFMMLAALLLDPEPPPLICLEEPELGLHPDVVVKLAALLRSASERTQLVVTTHSTTLVDALTESPECVIVCSREEGRTTMTRLDRKTLEPWLRDYNESLGKLWTSGEIGGNRW